MESVAPPCSNCRRAPEDGITFAFADGWFCLFCADLDDPAYHDWADYRERRPDGPLEPDTRPGAAWIVRPCRRCRTDFKPHWNYSLDAPRKMTSWHFCGWCCRLARLRIYARNAEPKDAFLPIAGLPDLELLDRYRELVARTPATLLAPELAAGLRTHFFPWFDAHPEEAPRTNQTLRVRCPTSRALSAGRTSRPCSPGLRRGRARRFRFRTPRWKRSPGLRR